MSGDAALRRLAEAAGIENGYWDLQGGHHEASPDSLRAVLAAVDIPAADEAEIAAGLRRLDAEAWLPLLTPATVVRVGEPVWVAVHLAQDSAARRLSWRLTLEGGEMHSGEAQVDVLALDDRRSIEGVDVERRRLPLPPAPCGYHRLFVEAAGAAAEASLIIVPARCWLPADLAGGGRRWGVAAQLYGLKSSRNWGIGDFADLGELGAWAQTRGADLIGINPLHARFPGEPGRASPYSPSSRLFLDPLYLDVAALADLQGTPELAELALRARAARSGGLMDYAGVSALKYRAFERAHARFTASVDRPDAARQAAFRRFQEDGGERLARFATFHALAWAQHAYDWTGWPQGLQSPVSADTAAFARAHADRIGFLQYLQWQAELQLGASSERLGSAGMAIGLYRDLAVSSAPDGADVWSAPGLFARRAELGAPPDAFNAQGQAWGLPPVRPRELRQDGYAYFAALLRANMRHAGALRIDHVMSLQRLFWIPKGAHASAGVYMRYPLEAMLGVLALESQRHQCLVVGEDLGVVPEAFRPRMESADVLSYRVLCFERQGERYRRPGEFPSLAAACVATHDLPTLSGFWSGEDLAAKRDAGQFETDEAFALAEVERRRDKRSLLDALSAEGLLAPTDDLGAMADRPLSPALAAAVHGYVARANAVLAMVQLEDLAGERHQANLPGTTTQYPNWRRRSPLSLAALARDPGADGILAAIVRERPGVSRRD